MTPYNKPLYSLHSTSKYPIYPNCFKHPCVSINKKGQKKAKKKAKKRPKKAKITCSPRMSTLFTNFLSSFKHSSSNINVHEFGKFTLIPIVQIMQWLLLPINKAIFQFGIWKNVIECFTIKTTKRVNIFCFSFQKITFISNFSCTFSNPNIFSNFEF